MERSKMIVGAMHRLELLRKIRMRTMMTKMGMHPGQPPLLEFILDHPGCTQKEAADELDVSPASAAASLKRLEKAGLVARQADQQDARRNQLELTEAGKEKIRAVREKMNALDKQTLAGISDQDAAQFLSICEKMFDNLADESTRGLTICKLHRAAHDALNDNKED